MLEYWLQRGQRFNQPIYVFAIVVCVRADSQAAAATGQHNAVVAAVLSHSPRVVSGQFERDNSRAWIVTKWLGFPMRNDYGTK